jgi:hypothetical protein
MKRKHIEATLALPRLPRTTTMLRLIIPTLAALVGAAALFGAGAFEDKRTSAGDAFLALLHASHAAAMAEKGAAEAR